MSKNLHKNTCEGFLASSSQFGRLHSSLSCYRRQGPFSTLCSPRAGPEQHATLVIVNYGSYPFKELPARRNTRCCSYPRCCSYSLMSVISSMDPIAVMARWLQRRIPPERDEVVQLSAPTTSTPLSILPTQPSWLLSRPSYLGARSIPSDGGHLNGPFYS